MPVIIKEWGGYRENSGRKFSWNYGATKAVKLPEVLMPDIVRYARLIDGSYPDSLQLETTLACNIESVTQSRAIQERLVEKSAECDRLNQECDRLSAQVGDLLLALDELRSQRTYESVTQSNQSSGSELDKELRSALAVLRLKIEEKAKGYTPNSFTRGIKDVLALTPSLREVPEQSGEANS